MKKHKINNKRLSRIITSRICMSAQGYLIELYDILTPSQRQEIKEMFEKNKKCCGITKI